MAVFDAPRSGRPPILTTAEVLPLAELLQTEPRQLKEVHIFTYERCRRSLKPKRDKGQLTKLQVYERQGLCKLYYFDESLTEDL